HYNIQTGPDSNPMVIEGCRISGSAWSGIRYGDRAAVIQNNVFFDNARLGIYADGDGKIQQNLFYQNAMGGIACWSPNKATVADNLFLDNEGGVYVNGECETVIRHN